jgi:hypothetical protein
LSNVGRYPTPVVGGRSALTFNISIFWPRRTTLSTQDGDNQRAQHDSGNNFLVRYLIGSLLGRLTSLPDGVCDLESFFFAVSGVVSEEGRISFARQAAIFQQYHQMARLSSQ